MSTSQKRDLATSLTTMLFIVIGITGVLMFFHIFDQYTKSIHEILGLAFVAVVFFHVVFNWKSMKNYFSKKIFLGSLVAITIVTLGFIVTSGNEGPHPKRVVFDSLFNAPLQDSVKIFQKDFVATKMVFESKGVFIHPDTTIEDIAKQMQTSPFEIITIITQ